MAKLVSKTYGEALFQIAMEKEEKTAGAGEEFFAELTALQGILKENPKFYDLMIHPGIAKTEKLSVMQKVFEGKTSPELYEFLRLLVEKDRYRDLDDIVEYVDDAMKAWKKMAETYVTTAVELTDLQKKQVEARILATAPFQSLEMHYTVDPSLIGGMVIRIGDRVVDSSVKRKLDDLTKQLLQIQLG
ncbi:MAG: ATP synthase F1 subunit delta [Lachnospiraceae bacterium]|nr:ATP synthase F1 subunit delta [Lachnospiraceae bacterium]MBQ2101818.1 ATP synthase F1 subunit delta [Lachnospiraceae bacterium]MBQ3905829.1 ATP synthase F1 subunit delta [Lachnospiraceae bacterium]MCR4598737.1 ATP synthase F1 subunit delta [Acetatifactor sp.]